MNNTPKRAEEKTIGELNEESTRRNIWEALPFTQSFIERHCDTKYATDKYTEFKTLMPVKVTIQRS